MTTIKLNSNGTEVFVLQHLLNINGSNLNVDGVFGRNTEVATVEFQNKARDQQGTPLDPDGIVGAKTWWALMFYNTPKTKTPKEVASDQITLNRIKTIHPQLRGELKEIYKMILSRGVSVRFTSVYRSFQEQEDLYARGRWGNFGNIVTHAHGGQSYHNYGLAVDICLLLENGQVSWDTTADFDRDQKADWMEAVQVFTHFGWEWGGNWSGFKDVPHFQKTFGYSTSELLAKIQSNEIEGNGYPKL